MAQSAEEAKRASFYCHKCHSSTKNHELIKLCACVKSMRNRDRSKSNVAQVLDVCTMDNSVAFIRRLNSGFFTPPIGTSEMSNEVGAPRHRRQNWSLRMTNQTWHGNPRTPLETLPLDMLSSMKAAIQEQSSGRFDSTGMFHWCPENLMSSCILEEDAVANQIHLFSDHIIVCIFADHRSPLLGLRSFIMPLRASNLHSSDLKTVILIGNLDYLKREWRTIANFPKIWVFPGSPLSRAHLRSMNINLASMIVILSSKSDNSIDDLTLADKEAILCSLNIKAMDFSDFDTTGITEDNVTSNPITILHNSNSNSRSLANCSTSSNPRNRVLVQNLIAKTVQGSKTEPQERKAMFYRPPRFVSKTGSSIPMATELSFDMNVQFLEQEDSDDESVELFMTQPFACGTAFTVSVLDSLMSTAYFNDSALMLIRSLVAGGSTPHLEKILDEGAGMLGGGSHSNNTTCRERCRVAQLMLNGGVFKQFAVEGTRFELLFLNALRDYGILIIGIYRLLRASTGKSHQDEYRSKRSCRRFVIANPPPNLPLHSTDWIFCLVPFKHNLEPSQIRKI